MASNPFDLTGRRALVTGGSGGIGRGLADALAQAGATVAVLGRSDRTDEVAAEIGEFRSAPTWPTATTSAAASTRQSSGSAGSMSW